MLNTFDTSESYSSRRSERDRHLANMRSPSSPEAAASASASALASSPAMIPRTVGIGGGQDDADALTHSSLGSGGSGSASGSGRSGMREAAAPADHRGDAPAPTGAIENARKFLWDSESNLNLPGGPSALSMPGQHFSDDLNDSHRTGSRATSSAKASLGYASDGSRDGARSLDGGGALDNGGLRRSSTGHGPPRRGRRKVRSSSGSFVPTGNASTGDIEQTVGGLFGNPPTNTGSGAGGDDLEGVDIVGTRGSGGGGGSGGGSRSKMPGRGSMDHVTTLFGGGQRAPPTLYRGQYDNDDGYGDDDINNGGASAFGAMASLKSGIVGATSAIGGVVSNLVNNNKSNSNQNRNGTAIDYNQNFAPRRPSGDPLDYADALARMQTNEHNTYPEDNETFVERARESLAELSYGCNHLMRECASSLCSSEGGGAMKKSLLLVAAAAILVGVIALGGGSMQTNPTGSGGGTTVSHPTNDDGNIDLQRMYAIQARVFDSGLSDRNALDVAGTPQYQAIHWLTAADEAQLSADDPYLLQRYGLAVFFFATYVTSEMEDRAGLPTVSDPNVSPGSEWKVVTNWMSGTGYCDWHGVECHTDEEGSRIYDANAGVTQLNLTANNIRGYLPNELGALSDLRVIDLGQNALTGSVPTSLGDLPLTTLYLGDNDLTGYIPSELGKLSTLTHLYLDRNVIRGGIPEEFQNLANLELLGLHENYLEGNLPDMSKWTKLRALYLDDNELSGELPTSIGAMVSLTDLRLSGNRFYSSIPKEIGNLKSLEEMYLQQNTFSGSLPPEMSKLASLREMQLYDNRISGELPSDLFSKMAKLEVAYLDHNALSGPLPRIWGCKGLRHLYVQNNKLQSELPEDIGTLQQLMSLRLNDNAFVGNLPEAWSRLTSLDHLYVNNNELVGKIPTGLSSLTSLVKMRVHGNKFSGSVPSGICELSLVELQADCAGNNPAVQCECCTECY